MSNRHKSGKERGRGGGQRKEGGDGVAWKRARGREGRAGEKRGSEESRRDEPEHRDRTKRNKGLNERKRKMREVVIGRV